MTRDAVGRFGAQFQRTGPERFFGNLAGPIMPRPQFVDAIRVDIKSGGVERARQLGCEREPDIAKTDHDDPRSIPHAVVL